MRPSKKSPKRVRRAEALAEKGVSQNKQAEEIGVSPSTLSRWRAKTKAKGRRKPSDDVQRAADEAAAVLASPPATGLEDLKQRLALIRGLLNRLAGPTLNEEFSPTSFVTINRYADELAKLVDELTPPSPVDPNETPDAREGERTLVARLETLVSAAEEKRARAPKCSACGQPMVTP